jgi:hypothetical protein
MFGSKQSTIWKGKAIMNSIKRRLTVVLVVAGLIFAGLTMLSGCGGDEEPPEPNATAQVR